MHTSICRKGILQMTQEEALQVKRQHRLEQLKSRVAAAVEMVGMEMRTSGSGGGRRGVRTSGLCGANLRNTAELPSARAADIAVPVAPIAVHTMRTSQPIQSSHLIQSIQSMQNIQSMQTASAGASNSWLPHHEFIIPPVSDAELPLQVSLPVFYFASSYILFQIFCPFSSISYYYYQLYKFRRLL